MIRICSLMFLIVILNCCNIFGATLDQSTQMQTKNSNQNFTMKKSVISNKKSKVVSKTKQQQSNKPLTPGEMLREASIDDIVKIFGKYESYDTASDELTTCNYISLKYKDLDIMIEYYELFTDEELGITLEEKQKEDFSPFYSFGERNVKLTDRIKKERGEIIDMQWKSPKYTGPRGIKVGDSKESVKKKFLDLSKKYNNKKVMYTAKDVYDEKAYSYYTQYYYDEVTYAKEFGFGEKADVYVPRSYYFDKYDSVLVYSVAKNPTPSESKQANINTDNWVHWDFESVYFFIKDGVVIEIQQSKPYEPC